ncbi:F-box/LRR-repeat protein [Trifolium repens]|nr:F-box/LRR-repeat protein [Trifolium repens]
MSRFPLKQLTSLSISDQRTFPANGLRAFSKKITTLTSLTCSYIDSINSSDLFLIAECFPLLEQLDLSYSSDYKNCSSYVDGVEALSLALIKLRKVNLTQFPINNQSLLHFFNNYELLYSIARERLPLTRFVLQSCGGHSYAGINCLLSKCQRIQHLNLRRTDFLNDQHVLELSSFLVDLVSINLTCCWQLTKSALFTLAKNCPSLSEIKMEKIGGKIVGNSVSLVEFGVYPQLKSLYLGQNSWLSDEIITMFASIFPNLQLLDLEYCHNISEGICQVLRKCCKIRHLNLAYCWEVKLHRMNFVVPNLEVLNLSWTNIDDETLYVISLNCRGLLQLLLERCKGVTKKGVKHVLENCILLRDHGYLLHTAKGDSRID